MTGAAGFQIEHRPLAVCRGWDDLRQAFRARCEELNVARTTVDTVGGLPEGQTSKLLSPVPDQEMGRISFPNLLGALALAVVVVEDAEAIARLRHRLTPRDTKRAHAAAKRATAKKPRRGQAWKGDKEWSRILNARRMVFQSKHQRKQIAQNAARARWAKRRRSVPEASP
jgi:hypothetical protein